jgi:hypothetical protein
VIRRLPGTTRQPLRIARVLRHLFDTDAHLLDGGRHAGRRVALHLGTVADLLGRVHQCRRLFEHGPRRLAHIADRRLQILGHRADGALQGTDLVATIGKQPAAQIAAGDPFGLEDDLVQWAAHPGACRHEAAGQGGQDDRHRHDGNVADGRIGAAADLFDITRGHDHPVPGRIVVEHRDFAAGAAFAGIGPVVTDDARLLVDHLANELETPAVLGRQQVGAFLGRMDGRHTLLDAGVERGDVTRFADLDGENPLFQCLEPFGQLKSDEEGTDHLACRHRVPGCSG